MGKCKNCGEETKRKNIYCSLKCRNIYVNKNIRNYNDTKIGFKKKRDKQKNEYLKNPKKCKECSKIIPFEEKNNNYCNQSCSAKFTNKFKKGIKKNFSEKGLKNILESIKKRYNTDDYYKDPKKCLNCDNDLEFQERKKVFCNINCKKEYFVNMKEDFELYRFLTKFKFSLNKYKDEFDFSLIEKYGWYKAKNHGDNVNGVSRDHIFSVGEGFRRLINPLLLSHPANCELILNRRNQSKHDNCSISLEELLKKIKIFEDKYGKYYEFDIKIHINLEELKNIYMQL